MTEPIVDGWVDTKEAGALTGYTVDYVRVLARRGLVVAQKVGRDWLVDLRSLMAHKRAMDVMGNAKHNPWRDDLADRGRKS